jgi:DNA-binding response OmpR family regulator/two-component sensor histidine kinase
MFDLAYRNAHRLKSQVDELLDLSKLEAGKMEIQMSSVPALDFFNRIGGMFDSYAADKGIEYQKSVHVPEDVVMEVDEPKLSKVISNLLSNAIKYTPRGGAVHYEIFMEAAEDDSASCRIIVSDNGMGISQDEISKVFDQYYQSQQPDTRPMGGTGIGLALVREYVHLMRGKVSVESELGQGSVFSVLLKLLVRQRPAVKEPPEEDTGRSHVSSEADHAPVTVDIQSEFRGTNHLPRLLMAEDHRDLRAYLRTILQPHYHVTEVVNGAEAWHFLQSEDGASIDLVLSDVMMPELDGLQLLEHVRQSSPMRHLPFIFLTARAGLDDKLDALRIGVDDYLTKPFEEEELLVRIDNLLSNSRARRELSYEEYSGSEEITTQPSELDSMIASMQQVVLENLTNPTFSIDMVSEKLAVSRRTLDRLIKRETGLTTNMFIREVRLVHARHLLESRQSVSVQAVAAEVGFQKVRYFSNLFKSRFGKLPSEYLDGHTISPE